jgi:hypothetical protein
MIQPCSIYLCPMIKKSLLLLTTLLILVHNTVFAWSREGHQIVVEIAYQLLSKPAQDKLRAYLGNISIQDAATWMDEVRGGDKQYTYLTGTHFINIEKGEKLNPFQKGNIYTELNTVISELEKSSNPAEIKMDLMILIHLVGDVHQPLHVGYGNDKGGNRINVSFMGRPTNLHSVWDGAIIGKQHINTQTIINNYKKLSATQIAAIKNENVAAWLSESRSWLPQIYAFSNSTIDENYVQKVTPIIEEQLLKAGIRLSAILEKVLNNLAALPPAPVAQTAQVKTGGTFTAFEAKDHIGEKITVCDKVFGTRFLESANGQPTFLNLGAAYPNSPFTIVIFGSERANFKEKPELFYNNKQVCATGLIKAYNGKPEMILASENEIKIVN